MLKDITLGQYFPGDTLIHKLDPRTKLLCVILYIVALFNAKGPLTYGIMIAVLAVCILISHVEWKALTPAFRKSKRPSTEKVLFCILCSPLFSGYPLLNLSVIASQCHLSGLRLPTFTSCKVLHLCLVGRCPNNNSLHPPLAAVVVA